MESNQSVARYGLPTMLFLLGNLSLNLENLIQIVNKTIIDSVQYLKV
jgi:hypothetical protein